MAWAACLAQACPVDMYAARLSDAGLILVAVENHDAVLLEMVGRIGSRLFAADILRGLKQDRSRRD